MRLWYLDGFCPIVTNVDILADPPGTFGPDGRVIKSPYYGYLVHQGVAFTFVILFGVTTCRCSRSNPYCLLISG